MSVIRYLLPLVLIAGCQSDYQMAEQSCLASGATAANLNSCTASWVAQKQSQRDRTSVAMAQASQILLSQNRPAPVIQPMRQPMNCTTRYNSFLNQMQTSCW